jgi:hypothetical protein
MSSGGIFKLLTNDGIQDKLLMASEYLKQRLQLIEKINRDKACKNGDKVDRTNINDSWLPTIDLISKSHIIFTNGSFKPFVACGFEYNKISGSADFNATTKFSLPQFGDFINDCVLHIKLTELQGLSYNDRVRYVSMLGHRLISKVSFSINGNFMDEYTTDNYNAFYEFHVPSSKRVGWLRNIGQEIPYTAFLTADPINDTIRQYLRFGDGNQTFKPSHDSVELWIPLLFWFREVHNALPNRAIPFGQTDISITFSKVSDIVAYSTLNAIDDPIKSGYADGNYKAPTISLCELYMNNIFMNPEISNIFINQFGFSLIRVHNKQNKTLTSNTLDIRLNELKWPTECLYVAFKPQINYTYSQYWQKNAILIPREVQIPVVAQNYDLTVKISEISAFNTNSITVETSKIGDETDPYDFTLVDYVGYYLEIAPGSPNYNSNDLESNRYRVTEVDSTTLPSPYNEKPLITIATNWRVPIVLGSTQFKFYKPEIVINVATYCKEIPVISTMEVKAYGIVIYSESSESFFNSYLPYRYGDYMNTPDDRGWYMINFNFFPGEHQPSGHINLSRAREFYLKYKCSTNVISTTNPVDLIVLADSINFLLVSDGSAVLRYST